MSILRRPIASLFNGVSQEALSLRLPSQCEAQVNGYSSLADGLRKRPASEHVEKLTATVHTSAHMHTINWAADEQFVVVIIDSDLFVYDLDGNAITVNFPDGKTYLDIAVGKSAAKEFQATTVEDITYIVNKTTKVDFDGTTTGAGTYQGKKQDFAALPGSPTDGDVWLIVGDGTIKAQGHYMKWVAATSTWVEAVNPGDEITLDPALMPHKLEYDSGTGQFTFQQETWKDKAAGDVITAPDPSFINRKIKDVFFHRNRLGFIAGEYTILSASGPDYTNFFMTTTTTVLDSDRIDLRAANIRVSKLKAALPFNRQLFTTSSVSQFILSTAIGQVMTPGSASLDASTSYAANTKAHPVGSGNSIFFPSEDTSYASLREYSVSGDSEITNVADNVTSHVPSYIPAGVYNMAIAEDFDTLFLLTTGDAQRIYVYKYFEEDGESVQNSWSYWEIDDATTILNADTLENYLYAVVTRADGTHLIRYNMAKDSSVADVTFPVLLDMRVLLTGSYSAVNDETTWTVPYDASGYTLQVIKDSGFTGAKGARVQGVTQPTATTVVADGDLTAGDCYIGVPYEFRFTFSEQFVRTNTQNDAGSPVLNGRLHLRNLIIRFNATGYIRAEVTPRAGQTPYSYAYGGKTLGAASLIIGEPNIDTGNFEFPVVADSKNVTIELVNDTHVPNNLISAEWTGNFTSKRGGA